MNSRVTSAMAAIKQLRALLSKAGTVSALLSVQEEINSQEANLEALLAQQRSLAHRTSYATISVTVIGQHVALVKKQAKIRRLPGRPARRLARARPGRRLGC